ncbi:MAG TPA: helicase, partial [Chloroflexi bacterium]|nr:helicase [Chloroflexota bacterium]
NGDGHKLNGDGHKRFTKRLVFSAWWVVPQIIASLLSYEAERLMIHEGGGNRRNTPEARKRARPLLRFQRQGPRIAGMASLSLLYPSPTLAKLADPLRLASEIGVDDAPAPVEAVAALAADKIGRAIRAVIPKGTPTEGPADLRWYWAAPLLLDAQNAELGSVEWLSRPGVSSVWSAEAESDDSALGDAIALALEVTADPTSLGRVPEDLVPVVTRQALAGPATCALRALARGAGAVNLVSNSDLRDGAAKVSWGFRSLFNTPEVMAMLRGPRAEEDAYWQKVLDYCLNGCLQSVLDEYAHVLREWLGILALDTKVIGNELGQTMYDALTVRAVNYRLDDIRPGGEDGMNVAPKNLRARFALRFGSQSAEEDGQLQRSGQVRAAFNSPFWPFVLATTSVGQEGLDFHLYCHAVVHWNLPANPVDLEQREGRVHRYKGHAIRKNVAASNRAAGFNRRGTDPWEGLFAAAKVGRSRGDGDLVPYWVYAPTEESARIERYVPSLPLSREIEKLEQLKRSLAVYRLAFGQPRQDDLAAYLADLSASRRLEVADELRIDLSP